MARRPKPVLWTLLAAAIVAAASILLSCRRYAAEVQAHRQIVVSRAETVLDALVAGIRAHGRMGRFSAERLGYILEELAAAPDILALELRTQAGTPIAAAGDVTLVPDSPLPGTVWHEDRFVMAVEPRLPMSGRYHRQGSGPGPDPARDLEHRPGEGPPRPPGPGGGRGWRQRAALDAAGWEEFPTGPHWLTVVLDTGAMRAQIQRDQVHLAVASVAWMLAVALGTWVVWARVRQRELAAELVVTQERAAQHERLAQLGAGLAHETKNPLGIVRGLAQSIGNAPRADAEVRRLAHAIIDEADRTVGRVNSFLTLARPKNPEPAPVALDNLIARLVSLVQPEAQQADLALEYQPSGLSVLADEGLLRRALLNILINAIRASRRGGRITVAAQPEADTVTLTVADQGHGIAPEDLPRVTEPYFTRFEGGTGLGLSIVEEIARAHDWKLAIESQPGQGARVSLRGLRRVE